MTRAKERVTSFRAKMRAGSPMPLKTESTVLFQRVHSIRRAGDRAGIFKSGKKKIHITASRRNVSETAILENRETWAQKM